MTETEREQNLMIVYAVEGYSQRHKLPEKDVLALFRETVLTASSAKTTTPSTPRAWMKAYHLPRMFWHG